MQCLEEGDFADSVAWNALRQHNTYVSAGAGKALQEHYFSLTFELDALERDEGRGDAMTCCRQAHKIDTKGSSKRRTNSTQGKGGKGEEAADLCIRRRKCLPQAFQVSHTRRLPSARHIRPLCHPFRARRPLLSSSSATRREDEMAVCMFGRHTDIVDG